MEDGLTQNAITRAPFQFGQSWQAVNLLGPCAPRRMFQWEAINDLPAHAVTAWDDAAYYFRDGFKVVLRGDDPDPLGKG